MLLVLHVCSAPEAGEYGLEVYVSDPDVDGSSMYLLCQYMIVCNEMVDGGVGARTWPNVPPGFMGPQSDFHTFGLQCTSHDDPYVVATTSELKVSYIGYLPPPPANLSSLGLELRLVIYIYTKAFQDTRHIVLDGAQIPLRPVEN